jgi:hypothetical protein
MVMAGEASRVEPVRGNGSRVFHAAGCIRMAALSETRTDSGVAGLTFPAALSTTRPQQDQGPRGGKGEKDA